ncbi:DUF309 domain-containing protein [Sulfitobacter sp. JB4-11]|uniref:DUF309 domain-containing protein n=1 Tax=Sulfitobacter rhodophyticola TaxID=3238304 RepID=UPI0035167ECA
MSEVTELPPGIPVPPFAYLPGNGQKLAESWFEPLKSSVNSGTALDELPQTDAWLAGRAYLHAGYFWECHEVLEVVWTRTPEGSAERDMVQALIQLANARMKHRMNRPRAAARLCAMVRAQLGRCPSDRLVLGLRVPQVLGWVAQTEAKLTAR